VYVLVRTDIPLADQVVQVGHACLEAGYRFKQPEVPCNLVVLKVSSEECLRFAIEEIELAGIRCAIFCEPDENMGYTAACTEPVTNFQRRLFRRFPLWSEDEALQCGRSPP
jgi:hypothetical protein